MRNSESAEADEPTMRRVCGERKHKFCAIGAAKLAWGLHSLARRLWQDYHSHVAYAYNTLPKATNSPYPPAAGKPPVRLW